MTPIYTYYDESVSVTQSENQRNILDIWQRSWSKHGWGPLVLGPPEAQKHPLFTKLTEHVKREYRGPNPLIYELACFHRWLALAVVGGGYMSDYDVVNYGLAPMPPRELPFEILAGHKNRGCPCFAWASKIGANWFNSQVLGFKKSNAGKFNYSDQTLCVLLCQSVLKSDTWDLCTVPWDGVSSPLIHFAHCCCPSGRIEAIKKYVRNWE